MIQVSIITLNQVTKLLIFIGVGYYLCRSRRFPRETGHILSMLVTYLFTPAYMLYHFSRNLTWDRMAGRLPLIGLSVILTLLMIGDGCLFGKLFSRSEEEREALTYGFTFSNVSYFGFPVIEGVFGAELLTDAMLFCIPIQMASYTFGYQIFDHSTHLSFKKLVNPFLIAMAVGAVVGLTGLQLPAVFTETLSVAGGCMSPLSMLLVGMEMARLPLKALFTSLRPYALTAFRLVGIPLMLGVILMLCGLRGKYLAVPLMSVAMPFGLNTVVFPENFGQEVSEHARLCFTSYLMSLMTLPLLFGVIFVLGM